MWDGLLGEGITEFAAAIPKLTNELVQSITTIVCIHAIELDFAAILISNKFSAALRSRDIQHSLIKIAWISVVAQNLT